MYLSISVCILELSRLQSSLPGLHHEFMAAPNRPHGTKTGREKAPALPARSARKELSG